MAAGWHRRIRGFAYASQRIGSHAAEQQRVPVDGKHPLEIRRVAVKVADEQSATWADCVAERWGVAV